RQLIKAGRQPVEQSSDSRGAVQDPAWIAKAADRDHRGRHAETVERIVEPRYRNRSAAMAIRPRNLHNIHGLTASMNSESGLRTRPSTTSKFEAENPAIPLWPAWQTRGDAKPHPAIKSASDLRSYIHK